MPTSHGQAGSDRIAAGMERAGESSEAVAAGEAAAPLRGLLELASVNRRHPTLLETLTAVATSVSRALAFKTVVVNVFRPESDDYEVVVVHGSDRDRARLLGEVTAARAWSPWLVPRFRRQGVHFVPEGSVDPAWSLHWCAPQIKIAASRSERGWRPHDALFATLDGAEGRRYGIISVAEPISGLRPEEQQLEVLGALAAHAVLTIESSRQLDALNAAVARNRALIAATLDSVIAVDRNGRLIEFNPAAERMFGYKCEAVIGREVADLLIPDQTLADYRRFVQRVRDDGDSELLDRRIETDFTRSDGSTFPIELTVIRVAGAEGDSPVFYAFLRDISQRRRGEEQLAYLAYHDALTGLPNRILVKQELELALARARRGDGAAAVMFVDLDDFKEVNDRFGHAVGDRLLAAVAARLRSVLRDTDVLARQGGDEFLVLLADLTDAPGGAAESVGGKLLDALRRPFILGGTEICTRASIGVSLYPDDAPDTDLLLRNADGAMYAAKAAGGGRLHFHRRRVR